MHGKIVIKASNYTLINAIHIVFKQCSEMGVTMLYKQSLLLLCTQLLILKFERYQNVMMPLEHSTV